MKSRSSIVIYGNKEKCDYCVKATALLDLNEVEYKYLDTSIPENLVYLKSNGYTTIPQIFAGEPSKETLIGGYAELAELFSAE